MKHRVPRVLPLLCLILAAALLTGGCGGTGGLSPTGAGEYPAERGEGFSGGSGTEQDPYRIAGEKDLRRFAELSADKMTGRENPYATAWYVLETDVSLSGKSWTPVAYFGGVFDGNGHTLSGLSLREEKDVRYLGLFSHLGGSVRNLSISDSYIRAEGDSTTVGAFAGMVRGQLINCHTTYSVSVRGPGSVGGLAGCVSGEGALLEDCSSAAAVTSAGGDAGGLAASLYAGVRNCVNTGPVMAAEGAGGLACSLGGRVEDCRNEGLVRGGKYAGGICRSFDGAMNGSASGAAVCLLRCVNTGIVSAGEKDAGGICAALRTGGVTDCRNEGPVSAGQYAGGIFGYFQVSAFGAPAGNCAISGCVNSGAVTSEGESQGAGGIGAHVSCSRTAMLVENCVNEGAVTAKKETQAGGILGSAGFSAAEEEAGPLRLAGCVNSGEVSCEAENCGGILGEVSVSGAPDDPLLFPVSLSGCGSTGKLSGAEGRTGLVGSVGWRVDLQIEDCSAAYDGGDGGEAESYPETGHRYEKP